MVKETRYNMVFMDCQMPEMDGYQATETIRKLEDSQRAATTIVAMRPPSIQKYYGDYDYYREKMGEEVVAKVAGAERGNVVEGDKKARRRERAQRGQEVSRRKRNLQSQVSQAEKRIESLEEEQRTLVGQMAGVDGSIDHEAVNRRLGEIQQALVQVTGLWEQSASELERLKAS